jgi:drug/metabolite transporter (DMT)-like permease
MTRDRAWRWKVATAFGVVYFVWGSTYLAIRVGVGALPPALFAGTRFAIAGILLAAYARFSGQVFPRGRGEWTTILVAALFLLVGANGLVVWGEQWVPSNQAALLAASVALWLAGLGTLGPRGEPLSPRNVSGLTLGFAGVSILLWPREGLVMEHLGAQLAVLLAGLSWASGSIFVKRRQPVTPPLMSAAMQSLAAGIVLIILGLFGGETSRWVWERDSMLALLYLIVFGSCLAYASYVWLLHEVSPSALGTYAYVNPAVAVVLGNLVLNETLSGLKWLGMAVILLGVILVNLPRPRVLPGI